MVAIVTGAGSRGLGVGNGKAAAVLFAREGARVALIDSVLARAEETQTMILAEGGECFAMEANVASGEDCKAIVDATVRRYGRLDILHNNVGIDPGIVSVVDVDEPTWDETMDVNVKSMMLMSKHAIPIMVAGGGGAIVNISSISALRPRGLTPYSVSKGAGYSPHTGDGGRPRPAAGPRQLHPPGPVYTPMVAEHMTPERRAVRAKAAPLGIEGNAWDIGYAALFLVSPEARWITGQVLPVDGGATLQGPAR